VSAAFESVEDHPGSQRAEAAPTPSAGSGRQGAEVPASRSVDVLEACDEVSAAVESGAGLPEVARATARALNASVAVVDASSRVLAVAGASAGDERALLSGGEGSRTLDLRVAETKVGQLHFRPRGAPAASGLLRMVATLIALEVERSRAPELASEAAQQALLYDLLERRATDRDNIVARAKELGSDLSAGGTVVFARAHPQQPEDGDWRARVLAIAERGARAVAGGGSLAAPAEMARGGPGQEAGPARRERHPSRAGQLVIVVGGSDSSLGGRVAAAVLRELEPC
jgi:hypothetical protein